MARLIALDLGSHRVKLAVYEGGFGRYQLEQLLAAPVEAENGEHASYEARLAGVEALRAQLSDSKRPEWVVAWPAERTSLRQVRLPFSEKAQIERVLPFEVEGMVPFDLETVELRHRLLRSAPGEGRVLAAMVERDGLQDWLRMLSEAHVDPRSVDIDVDLSSELAGAGVQAVIDLGHSRTLLSICQDGQVVAARALDQGARDLTAALMKAHGLSWAEAEARKHAAQLAGEAPAAAVQVEWEGEETTAPGVRAAKVTTNLAAGSEALDDGRVLTEALQPLLAELRSSLIGFEDSLALGIDEVLLVGGGAHLGGLRKLLQQLLGVPVRLLQSPSPTIPETEAGSWALVQALGTRATRGKDPAMELRRGELAYKGDLYLIRQVGLYGGVFAACALLAGTVMFGVRAVQLDNRIAELDTQIADALVEVLPGEITAAQVDSPQKALAIMAEKSAEAQAQVEELGGIIADEPPTVGLLRDLGKALPPHSEARIDVEELTVTTTTITVKAETDGYETATRIESSLQAAERFKGAKKGDEKKTRGGAISFTVTIPRESSVATSEEG